MKYYFFTPRTFSPGFNSSHFIDTLTKIAESTDTTDLVVAHYMEMGKKWSGGTAYAHNWLTREFFKTSRGKWNFTSQYNTPDSLPPKFKLVRMQLCEVASYPYTELDRYGWQHCYNSLQDRLAFLFAHELFHFRRFHLGLHPGGGEQAANKWALSHVQSCGFSVKSLKIKRKKRKSKKSEFDFYKVVNPMDFVKTFSLSGKNKWQTLLNNILLNISRRKQQEYIKEKEDHFKKLRSLIPGTLLYVDYDPSNKYNQQKVKLIRSLRKNSTRIVIQTGDGKDWRWPMAWLKEISSP